MELELLIVEDDRLLAESVSDYFTAKEWKVEPYTMATAPWKSWNKRPIR